MMENLRRQSIDHRDAFEFYIAAEARSSRTNYADDQAWTVKLGARDEAAFAFQTQIGGRAGLVSLVPIWVFKDRSIYQCFAYAEAPVIRQIAPNFVQIEASPTPDLGLVARFWVMESQAAGGQFTLTNRSAEDASLQLDLFGHVVINGRNCKLNVLTMADYTLALHLGQIGDINPVVTLEGASVEVYGGRINSPKIGRRFTIRAGETVSLPFVVAGLADMRNSFSLAMNWMSRPWSPYFERINRDAAAVPRITTGNPNWDRVIDLSCIHLLQSFMGASEHLPQTSFVANRAGNRGWSRRGDGSDHIRSWSGQDPTLAYLAIPAVASIDGDLAKAVIRNYLAIQDETGFIDRQPGLGGQRQGYLMMPLLARLSWLVYEHSEDETFLAEVLPALLAFFWRWLDAEFDADRDGVPEWRSERQLGYVAFPTFGRGQYWAQGADIRQMEGPDILAYLISEADALCRIADHVGEVETKQVISNQLDVLETALEEFWDGNHYRYRDRDTHLTSESIEFLQGGAGDEIHDIKRELLKPARVMIRVVGGLSQRPRITLKLEGEDEAGRSCTIDAGVDDFLWLNRQGVYISEQTLLKVTRVAISGLSRVYKVYARTIGSSRLDINALLPLWSGRLSKARAAMLTKLALDEKHFLRPKGITMVSASDRHFDPSNARGGGGIWMYWLSLVGEGLVKSGSRADASMLIKRVLEGLSGVLEREGFLSQFYHADETKGFGENHHIGGIVPLHLLSETIGVRILSPGKVWLGGEFTWSEPITVEQHGVMVQRSSEGIIVEFPSGHRETLPPNSPWQECVDPTPVENEYLEIELPAAPEADIERMDQDERRVVITVDDEDSNPVQEGKGECTQGESENDSAQDID